MMQRASRWAPAALAFGCAMLCSMVLAGATHPPGVFPKYLEAVRAPQAVQAERFLDYSPLYLALVRVLAPLGNHGIFWVQCAMHAFAAAAVALAVGALAPWAYALAAGLATASYRPFLVYCGIEEPEIAIVASLAIGIWMGVRSRQLLSGSPMSDDGHGARAVVGSSVWLRVAGAGAAISAAAILRPQYLLLIPVWGLWIGAAAVRHVRVRIFALTGAVALIIVFPVFLTRSLAAGFPVIMNPGPVFYEGNGPAATGLARHAPEVVRLLEQSHAESIDYGHVAYRRIASASIGRACGVVETNRFWTRLALEGMREHPAETLKRLAGKTLMAVMPYEAHDLIVAEDIDRRTRRLIPWGFGILLVVVPLAALSNRSAWAALAGPLSIGALSIVVQIVFYASARQRLPLALALLVIGPPLLAAWWSEELGMRIRRPISLSLGFALCALLAFESAPIAISDQLIWDRVVRSAPHSPGETLASLLDGRLLERYGAEDARLFAVSVQLMRSGRVREAASAIEPLTRRGRDFTVADGTIGVPEYWLAVAQLVLGQRERALEWATAAERTRPGEPRISALKLRLGRRDEFDSLAASWRPAGCDRLDALWALAAAAVADGDPEAASRIAAPVTALLPELEGRPIRPY